MSQSSVYIPADWISLAMFRGGACYTLTGSQLSNNSALFTLAAAKGVAGLSEKVLPQLSTSLCPCTAHTLRRIYFNYRVCKNQTTIDQAYFAPAATNAQQ